MIFPETIKSIAIYNASFGTRELPKALLSAIRAVHPHPELISIVNMFEYDRDDVLYIVICPAGFGASGISKGPKYYISYQLEPTATLDKPTYRPLLAAALVNWDYSQPNIQHLSTDSNVRCRYVPVGYTPSISASTIVYDSYLYNEQDKDVDVLFLGYADAYPRRLRIRDDLYRRGLRIWFVSAFDLPQMQEAIKRARVCLNYHQADNMHCLETIRLNILLSNCACVVSEDVNAPEYDDYKDAIIFTSYDKLVDKCYELKHQVNERRAQATKSYQWYSTKRRWNDLVDFTTLLPSC